MSKLFQSSLPQTASKVFGVETNPDAKAIVFVHGLGSTAEASWTKLIALCRTDPYFNAFSLDVFRYRTGLFRLLPFGRKMARIQELAGALATELEDRHGGCPDLTIVAHSLGGLIARRYILDQLRQRKRPLAKRLILYAVPNHGASIADVGSIFSWRHYHLRQLGFHSDLIEQINDDWSHLEAENALDVRYVIGAIDNIVSPQSARGQAAPANVSIIAMGDHSSIIQADSLQDIRYTVMKHFISGTRDQKLAAPHISTLPGDPLFDIYRVEDEPFYIERSIDRNVTSIISHSNLWLTGTSGMGKTSAVRRGAILSGAQLIHLLLASYEDRSPASLLKAISVELADHCAFDAPHVPTNSSDAISLVRASIRSSKGHEPLVILIEEIPITKDTDYLEFLDLIHNLMLVLGTTLHINRRVVFGFSSIRDPSSLITPPMAKLRETLQFVPVDLWSNRDILRLMEVVMRALHINLSADDKMRVVAEAGGSPRFVKSLFRRWRNGTASELPLEVLLAQTKSENFHNA
ncbi:esterase/lipase family protein [Acidisoma sp. 7E03]